MDERIVSPEGWLWARPEGPRAEVTGLRRAFLAIVPPEEVLDAVDRLLERPKKSMFAWTRRDQWHITMQFYGRVDDPDTLCEGIAAAAAASPPARLVLRGGGAFPNPKKAQVYWLGVDGTDALIDLHALVAAATRDFIGRRDRITLKPHLTLAHLKRSVDLTPDVEALAGVPVGPPWVATELVLLESQSRPGGSVYAEQGRFRLGS
jgi:RNA 2',3'-cyclic 3'-phosphodiesterase